MPGPLIAVPVVLGGAALVSWLMRISSGTGLSSKKGPQGETITAIPVGPPLAPLKTFTTQDVYPTPPPPPAPPKPAPELPPPVAAKVEAPVPPPPAPVITEKPAPVAVAPAPVAPVVAPPPPVVSAPPPVPVAVAPAPVPVVEPPHVELPPAPPPPPSPAPELPAPAPAPVAAQPPPPPPPAPVTAPVPADVAQKPVGYDPELARSLAKKVADNLQKAPKWGYDRKQLAKFQLAAGIPSDGLYGPESKATLAYFGIKRPPLAQFKGADGTYADVPYRWA